jgi:hypothetical protein
MTRGMAVTPPMGDQEPEQGPQQLQPPNGPAEADVAAGLPQVEEAQEFDMQEQQQPEAQAHPIDAEAAEPVPQEQPQLEHEMTNPVPERPAAPGTARWLRENADQTVVQGGKDIMTVIFTMLSILAYKNIHKETFDLVMSCLQSATSCLQGTTGRGMCPCIDATPPHSESAPSSPYDKCNFAQRWRCCCRTYHLCSRAFGVENPHAFEHHMCTNCCKVFPDLRREIWGAHIGDYCENCGEPRFKIVAGTPMPRKRCVSHLHCRRFA